MEPFTLMAIGLGLSAVAKGVGGAMDAAALHTEADKERLEELERLQDLNQLGLTEEESARMSEAMIDPLQAQQRQRSIERREMAAGADLGAGAVSRQMMLGEEAEQRAMQDVEKQLAATDLQKSQQQKAEIQALKKGADLRKNQMLKAIITGTAEGAGQIIGAKGQTMAFEEMTGQATVSVQQQDAYRQQMIQQQYMSQMYGQQYQPYQQYYDRYYGQQYQMPPYFSPQAPTGPPE